MKELELRLTSAIMCLLLLQGITCGKAERLFDSSYRTGENYINIDCGNGEIKTNENQRPESEFIDTGKNMLVSPEFISNNYETFRTVRSFPDGKRNCYTIKPADGINRKYLIRALFLYGNYDGLNKSPVFDLYVGVNFWVTINVTNEKKRIATEIIYKPVSDLIHVCLINTDNGTPFISDLVLRPIGISLYNSGSGSLKTIRRYDIGSKDSTASYRSYPGDPLDRFWSPLSIDNIESWEIEENPAESLKKLGEDEYKLPQSIFATQAKASPGEGSSSIDYVSSENVPNAEYYFYWHFAETESFSDGSSRQFYIYTMNNSTPLQQLPYKLEYLKPITISSTAIKPMPDPDSTPITMSSAAIQFGPDPDLTPIKISSTAIKLGPDPDSTLTFSIRQANDTSTSIGHPPILNALELFKDMNLSIPATHQNDVDAIMDVKRKYSEVIKGWGGDPCLPIQPWDGLTCTNDSITDPPRIITLDLSSRHLTGNILSSLSNLSSLTYLNLSDNSLTGEIPEFLSEMQNLQHMYL